MLAMDEGDVPAAEHWFRQAILIKEDFRAALFNLALLLADDHRPLQAAPFLNQLVRFHPDHVKALILLGDIYINNIKDLDAAENVRTSNLMCIRIIELFECSNIQILISVLDATIPNLFYPFFHENLFMLFIINK
jgi:hypothetical protein